LNNFIFALNLIFLTIASRLSKLNLPQQIVPYRWVAPFT
jgi:hypothetical protein